MGPETNPSIVTLTPIPPPSFLSFFLLVRTISPYISLSPCPPPIPPIAFLSYRKSKKADMQMGLIKSY